MLLRYFLPRDARAYIDSLSGITVALALMPEAIAFALVAHLSPLVGLFATFFMCTIPALIGGRPGMISGATGSTAVVMVSLVIGHGASYLFAAVILAGVFQMILGSLRIGKAVQFFSKSLMIGFVNGLAIIIFLAQLHQFKHIVGGQEHWLPTAALGVMIALVVASLVIMWALPKLTKKIPAALTAIVVITLIVECFGIHTRIVSDMMQGASMSAHFPAFSLPAIPLTWHSLEIILPYAVVLSVVGLSETLITQRIVDDKTKTTSAPNRECVAQGIANTVSGFFGTMGGCAMIGQSMINITSGARGRLSGIIAGVFLLVFVLLVWPLIRLIPLAALVGVMFMVVFETFEWGTFKVLRKIPRFDAVIILSVMAVTISINLAAAVAVGIVMAAMKFCWETAKSVRVTRDNSGPDGCCNYSVRGPIFFASSHAFTKQFDYEKKSSLVEIDLSHATIYDHSAIDSLILVVSSFRKAGSRVLLKNLSKGCQARLQKASLLITESISS